MVKIHRIRSMGYKSLIGVKLDTYVIHEQAHARE